MNMSSKLVRLLRKLWQYIPRFKYLPNRSTSASSLSLVKPTYGSLFSLNGTELASLTNSEVKSEEYLENNNIYDLSVNPTQQPSLNHSKNNVENKKRKGKEDLLEPNSKLPHGFRTTWLNVELKYHAKCPQEFNNYYKEDHIGEILDPELKEKHKVLNGKFIVHMKIFNGKLEDGRCNFENELTVLHEMRKFKSFPKLYAFIESKDSRPLCIMTKETPVTMVEYMNSSRYYGGLSRYVLFCLREIASGMAELHKRGIVHRKLCPTNILIDLQEGRKSLQYKILIGSLDHSRLISEMDSFEIDENTRNSMFKYPEGLVYVMPEIIAKSFGFEICYPPEQDKEFMLKAADLYSFAMIGFFLLEKNFQMKKVIIGRPYFAEICKNKTINIPPPPWSNSNAEIIGEINDGEGLLELIEACFKKTTKFSIADTQLRKFSFKETVKKKNYAAKNLAKDRIIKSSHY